MPKTRDFLLVTLSEGRGTQTARRERWVGLETWMYASETRLWYGCAPRSVRDRAAAECELDCGDRHLRLEWVPLLWALLGLGALYVDLARDGSLLTTAGSVGPLPEGQGSQSRVPPASSHLSSRGGRGPPERVVRSHRQTRAAGVGRRSGIGAAGV